MEKITQFGSRKEWSAAIWSKILKDMGDTQSAKMLDALLSIDEKERLVNRLPAIALIRQGESYRKIGEELWLSPTTISSLRKIFVKKFSGTYESYNKSRKRAGSIKKGKTGEAAKDTPIIDWLEYYLSLLPEKNGPRWKFFKRRPGSLVSGIPRTNKKVGIKKN